MPALPPLTDAQWPSDLADLLKGFAGGLNVYRVMAHNPALLRAWEGLQAMSPSTCRPGRSCPDPSCGCSNR